MTHEEGFDGSTSRVKGWKCTENHWRGGERGGVKVDAEELVNGGKTGGRALHGVVGRCQAVFVLIPRWSTWEQELYDNTGHVHVAESSCKDGCGAWRTEEEQQARDDEGSAEMCDTIREPGQNVEGHGLVCRQYIAQIGTVHDVFQCWKHSNPNWGSVFARDKSVKLSVFYPLH